MSMKKLLDDPIIAIYEPLDTDRITCFECFDKKNSPLSYEKTLSKFDKKNLPMIRLKMVNYINGIFF